MLWIFGCVILLQVFSVSNTYNLKTIEQNTYYNNTLSTARLVIDKVTQKVETDHQHVASERTTITHAVHTIQCTTVTDKDLKHYRAKREINSQDTPVSYEVYNGDYGPNGQPVILKGYSEQTVKPFKYKQYATPPGLHENSPYTQMEKVENPFMKSGGFSTRNNVKQNATTKERDGLRRRVPFPSEDLSQTIVTSTTKTLGIFGEEKFGIDNDVVESLKMPRRLGLRELQYEGLDGEYNTGEGLGKGFHPGQNPTGPHNHEDFEAEYGASPKPEFLTESTNDPAGPGTASERTPTSHQQFNNGNVARVGNQQEIGISSAIFNANGGSFDTGGPGGHSVGQGRPPVMPIGAGFGPSGLRGDHELTKGGYGMNRPGNYRGSRNIQGLNGPFDPRPAEVNNGPIEYQGRITQGGYSQNEPGRYQFGSFIGQSGQNGGPNSLRGHYRAPGNGYGPVGSNYPAEHEDGIVRPGSYPGSSYGNRGVPARGTGGNYGPQGYDRPLFTYGNRPEPYGRPPQGSGRPDFAPFKPYRATYSRNIARNDATTPSGQLDKGITTTAYTETTRFEGSVEVQPSEFEIAPRKPDSGPPRPMRNRKELPRWPVPEGPDPSKYDSIFGDHHIPPAGGPTGYPGGHYQEPGNSYPGGPYPGGHGPGGERPSGPYPGHPGPGGPGSPYPGGEIPGGQYPSGPSGQYPSGPGGPGGVGPYPGVQRPGGPYPGGQGPSGPFHGRPGPGNPFPGGERPGGPYPRDQAPTGPFPGGPRPGGRYPGLPYPGRPYPGDQGPGSSFPGGPGSPFPGDQNTGGQYPGGQEHSHPFPEPGNPLPGDQYPGGPYPSVQRPNRPYPGSPGPGSPFPGGQYPDGQYPGGQPNGQYLGGERPDGQYPGGQPNGQYPGGQGPSQPNPGSQNQGFQYPDGARPEVPFPGGASPSGQHPGDQGAPGTGGVTLRDTSNSTSNMERPANSTSFISQTSEPSVSTTEITAIEDVIEKKHAGLDDGEKTGNDPSDNFPEEGEVRPENVTEATEDNRLPEERIKDFMNEYDPEAKYTTMSFRDKIRGKMVELQSGYLTVFLSKTFAYLALKDERDMSRLLYRIEPSIEVFRDRLYYFGQPLGKHVHHLAEQISFYKKDELKNFLAMFHKAIDNRHAVLSKDLNTIIDYVDELYTEEEGESIIRLLGDIAAYPNISITADKLVRDTFERVFYNLYRRLRDEHDKRKDKIILALNQYVKANFLEESQIKIPKESRRYDTYDTNNKKPHHVTELSRIDNRKENTNRRVKTKYENTVDENALVIGKMANRRQNSYNNDDDNKDHRQKNNVGMGRVTKPSKGNSLHNEKIQKNRHNSRDQVFNSEYKHPKVYENYIKRQTKSVKVHMRQNHHNYERLIDSYINKRGDTNEKEFEHKLTHDTDKILSPKDVHRRGQKENVSSYNFVKSNGKMDNEHKISESGKLEEEYRYKKAIKNHKKNNKAIEIESSYSDYNTESYSDEDSTRDAKTSNERLSTIHDKDHSPVHSKHEIDKDEIRNQIRNKDKKIKQALFKTVRDNTTKVSKKHGVDVPKKMLINYDMKEVTTNYEIIKRRRYKTKRMRNKQKEGPRNKEDMLIRKLTESSSYSDDENDLKMNLNDVMVHGDARVKEPSRRMNNVKKPNIIHEISSVSDEEHVFKRNIYKAFGEFITNASQFHPRRSDLSTVTPTDLVPN